MNETYAAPELCKVYTYVASGSRKAWLGNHESTVTFLWSFYDLSPDVDGQKTSAAVDLVYTQCSAVLAPDKRPFMQAAPELDMLLLTL